MLVIPAIDIYDGKAVRLEKGDMEKRKEYFDNPLDAAKYFQDLGVGRIHIVDLNGAKEGKTTNFKIIEKIVASTDLIIEVGGGIRDKERVNGYFNLGVCYAILGTATVKNPPFVKEMLALYPEKIILGIDAKQGYVATEGWYEKSDMTVVDVLAMYDGYKPESVIYTDISRDGMLTGINIDATVDLSKKTNFNIIASGGLKGLEDIKILKKSGKIYGCIIGKAFYEGKIDLKEALEIANA
ncbi:1-(5-phosphoribosyl)-5-[(5-phosphoribosylamino)methylideneamino]imidazole-4-carboxamide isomerase [Deferribacteraceae bacterium V6Fe1]|nr:1-(5-phosphoribosyl)-5-[(5-phosphoribosylamino)methylideneamino]imidazole-4-carboxamide isomerase [Deferribacteraceae bacterium V6Fe1]